MEYHGHKTQGMVDQSQHGAAVVATVWAALLMGACIAALFDYSPEPMTAQLSPVLAAASQSQPQH